MTNETRQRGDHPIEPPDRTRPTPSVYRPTSGAIDRVTTGTKAQHLAEGIARGH